MKNNQESGYNPLVSVAMATYNGERFLRQQLDSILSQTYRNLELVISDDNSSDYTQKILKEYASRDERIIFSVNPSPDGYKRNFERAVRSCRGEIVFLCDQDDIWYNHKIETHLEKYRDSSIKWIYNEVRLINEKGDSIGLLTDYLGNSYYEPRKLLYHTWGSCILGCATSYRASCLKNIWPIDKFAPAHDSWIQLAIFPAKSFHIPSILQDYRRHAANATGITPTGKEEEAISDNFRYLASLIGNNRIKLWKRFVFLAVLLGKYVRRFLNKAKRLIK